MKYTAKRTFTVALGSVLVVIGVAGLILPIVNGTFPLIAGIILLAREFPWVDAQVEKHIHKHPRVTRVYRAIQSWINARMMPK